MPSFKALPLLVLLGSYGCASPGHAAAELAAGVANAALSSSGSTPESNVPEEQQKLDERARLEKRKKKEEEERKAAEEKLRAAEGRKKGSTYYPSF